MGLLHTCLAVATVAVTQDMNLAAPVFRMTVDVQDYTMDHAANVAILEERVANGSLATMHDAFQVALEPLPSGLPIAWLTLWFFLLTAASHFGAAFVYPTLYVSFLKNKRNPLRWIEYAITASLMWLVLAHAFAFVDVNALVLSTAMIATTMASGWHCECVARPHPHDDAWTLPLATRLVPLVPGIVLYGTAALTLCISMWTGVEGELPAFVVPTVLVTLGLFESFVIVILWQQCHPPSKWILGEDAFQTLSLVSKALLGIVLMVNVLAYEDYACVFAPSSCT